MVTTVKLWRNGNATSPRLDNVRDGDIVTWDYQGRTYVQAGTGGVSTYADGTPGYPTPGQKNWWSLAAGSEISTFLNVVLDPAIAGHYLWEPAYNMPLARYVNALKEAGTAPPWVKRVLAEEEVPAAEVAGVAGAGNTSGPAEAVRSDGMNASPKTLRFIVAALDHEIGHLADAIEDESRSEDEQSDLTNDLALYRLIRQKIQADHDALVEEIRARSSAPGGIEGDEQGGVTQT